MNRISFLTRISSFFRYNKELNNGVVSLTLKGNEAETLFDLIKSNASKEKLTHYFLHSKEISNFMLKTESTYLNDIYFNLNIEIILDQYQLSDYDTLAYDITFNPNELYDFVINDYYKNELELITIYRVEENDFTGVYTSGLAHKQVVRHNQPAPFQDGDINQIFTNDRMGLSTEYTNKWFFAFSNLNDIDKWFDPKILDVTELISIYTIPKRLTVSGRKQLIFKKDYSKYLGRFINS